MSNKLKGSIGYIDSIKRDSLKKAMIGFVSFLGIFLLSSFLAGSNKNIGTIIAVLVALPTAQQFARYFGYRGYKSIDQALASSLSDSKSSTILYELLVVRGKVTYCIDVVLITDNMLYLLINTDSKLNQSRDVVRQEIQTMMNHKGIKINTQCYDVVDDFRQSLPNVNVLDEDKHDQIKRALLGSSM